MQVIRLSQTEDRQQWLDERRGVITGTKSKGVQPPKRGNTIPQGIYELVAERLAIAKDGEPEIDRGLRLENEGLLLTSVKIGLPLDLDPGMWLSDDGKQAISPDAAEPGDVITYAAENKSLDSKNHLQAILNDHIAKQSENYNPLDSLKIGTSDYSYQATQYFLINPNLKTLYFGLYDDRIALENLVHYVIIIERADVEDRLQQQIEGNQNAIELVEKFIKILKEVE